MDVSLTESVITQLNRGKKRKLNIDKWAQNVRKRRRDSGNSYVSSRKVPKEAVRRPDEVSWVGYKLFHIFYHDFFLEACL